MESFRYWNNFGSISGSIVWFPPRSCTHDGGAPEGVVAPSFLTRPFGGEEREGGGEIGGGEKKERERERGRGRGDVWVCMRGCVWEWGRVRG